MNENDDDGERSGTRCNRKMGGKGLDHLVRSNEIEIAEVDSGKWTREKVNHTEFEESEQGPKTYLVVVVARVWSGRVRVFRRVSAFVIVRSIWVGHFWTFSQERKRTTKT